MGRYGVSIDMKQYFVCDWKCLKKVEKYMYKTNNIHMKNVKKNNEKNNWLKNERGIVFENVK